MSTISTVISDDEFKVRLAAFFVALATERIEPNTPMSVVRQRLIAAGKVYGRCLLVGLVDGNSPGMANALPAAEEEGEQAFLANLIPTLGPGGKVRKSMAGI